MASKIGQQEAELNELGEGMHANLPPETSLAIQGTALAKARSDEAAAKKAYQDALAARLAITADASAFCKAFKVALKQYFGCQNPILEAFGIPVEKPSVAKPEQKALANARRAQTRAARGPGGKAKLVIVAAGCPPVTVPPNGSLRIRTPATEALSAPRSLSEAVHLARPSKK